MRTCKQDRIRELEEQLENKPAPLETRRADSEEIRVLKREIDMLRNRPTWTTVIPKVARPFQRRHEEPQPHAHIHRVCTYIYTQEKPPEEKIVYVDVPVEKIVEKIVRSAPSESRPRPSTKMSMLTRLSTSTKLSMWTYRCTRTRSCISTSSLRSKSRR